MFLDRFLNEPTTVKDRVPRARDTPVTLSLYRGNTAAQVDQHFVEQVDDVLAQSVATRAEQSSDTTCDGLELALDAAQLVDGVIQLARPLERPKLTSEIVVVVHTFAVVVNRRRHILLLGEVEEIRRHTVLVFVGEDEFVIVEVVRGGDDERDGVRVTVRSLSPGSSPQSLVQLSLGAAEASQLSLVDAVLIFDGIEDEELARVGSFADATAAGDVKEAGDELLGVRLAVKVCPLGEGVAKGEPEVEGDARAPPHACVWMDAGVKRRECRLEKEQAYRNVRR